MIQTLSGDLLESEGIIVHGCNAQGVMASGVARQIKSSFPQAFLAYSRGIQYNKNKTGWVTWYPESNKRIICNAVTQQFYGRDKNTVYVDYEAIKECFETINLFARSNPNIKDINFPLIGCGLANGEWNIVSEIIDEALDDNLNKILWVR